MCFILCSHKKNAHQGWSSLMLQWCDKRNRTICISYPAVSWLIHVTLNLACIRHQVLHSPVLQSCRVWGGEYGLYSEERQQKKYKTQSWYIKFYSISTWQYFTLSSTSVSLFDLQFVHQVGAQVLSDMFVPGLPYPRSRERGGSGQVSHASCYWPIWHQLTVGQREENSFTHVQNKRFKSSHTKFH